MSRGRFRDRHDAGDALATLIHDETTERPLRAPIVLALPRGGVPVGAVVAERLGAGLDVLVVRKLGVPGHEELAMGAIASSGIVVRNDDVIAGSAIADTEFDAVLRREQVELARREQEFRGGEGLADVMGRSVIVVDDGAATGATMRAALAALPTLDPYEVIVGLPVAPPELLDELEAQADRVYCVTTPSWFHGVGQAYDDFSQTTTAEVRRILAEAS